MSLDHPENRAAAAASQALEDYASTVRALDAQVRTLRRRAEAAEARAERLSTALRGIEKDAGSLSAAFARNRKALIDALAFAGMNHSFLAGWEAKVERIAMACRGEGGR